MSATPSSTFPTSFGNMSDVQLRQTISQLSSAARSDQFPVYASPTPQPAQSTTYLRNLHTWSTTTTPPPKNASSGTRSTRARANRGSALASATPTTYTPTYQQTLQQQQHITPIIQAGEPNPPRAPLPTTSQALHSTYASRLRTGTTLLMQPILPTASATTTTRTTARRGGVVNYTDPGSGDDIPDAGALDSDDSDFVASGGTRTAIRSQRNNRLATGMSVFHSTTGVSSTPHPQPSQRAEKAELDQSYLGMIPPSRFIKAKPVAPTPHEYPPQTALEAQAQKPTVLVPIRVEFETETHRIRDCFVWNLHESLIKPQAFAETFCADLDLPAVWADTVANQIRAQLEEHEGVASMDLGVDGAIDIDAASEPGEEVPECRVIVSIDVQIATHHLLDHIEWDLLSPLTPEAFSQKLCTELGLSGEAIPLVAHAIHEELMKHKKDAVEWGVIGGDRDPAPGDEHLGAGATLGATKPGFVFLKDKTGLGLGWGRAPKDGRGPKPLRSVWRDWAEAEEFRTKFEVLSAEEVERREIEKERASRRLRRETSKFQSSTRTRRR